MAAIYSAWFIGSVTIAAQTFTVNGVAVVVPAGTYYLTLDPDMAPDKPVAVRDQLEVHTAGAGWSNFVLVMIFLIIFPIFTSTRTGE